MLYYFEFVSQVMYAVQIHPFIKATVSDKYRDDPTNSNHENKG